MDGAKGSETVDEIFTQFASWDPQSFEGFGNEQRGEDSVWAVDFQSFEDNSNDGEQEQCQWFDDYDISKYQSQQQQDTKFRSQDAKKVLTESFKLIDHSSDSSPIEEAIENR